MASRAGFLAILLLAAACESTRPPDSPGTLTTAIFDDIPAPRDARYRAGAGESFSYQSETFRCGRFVFEYAGEPASAADFFRETMTRPPYNWTLENDGAGPEEGLQLGLTKLDDHCAVELRPLPTTVASGAPRTSITVRVNVTR